MLVLEILTTLCRQRGNGATDVSHESRTAQMSALFHIFMCAFVFRNQSYCFADFADFADSYCLAALLKIIAGGRAENIKNCLD